MTKQVVSQLVRTDASELERNVPNLSEDATSGPATCAICAAHGSARFYEIPEMMFGLRERFEYFQCGGCGCLQLAKIPPDLNRFYSEGYYAHQPRRSSYWRVAEFLRTLRNRYAFTGDGTVGKLLFQNVVYYGGEIFRWLKPCGINFDSRILDVGCGSGQLLLDFRAQGYHDLLGIDPFIAEDLNYPEGVRVVKASLEQVEGSFDLIMLHHSLEHIPDQLRTFRSLARLLAPGGCCVIRIPIVSSFAWEHYREDWVQIDAPRHLFLHTVDSLRLLGTAAGLELVDVIYDSTEFQFIGSEMYRRDIPLAATSRGLFSKPELRKFRRRARELNAQERGDSAAFIFRLQSQTENQPGRIVRDDNPN